MFVIDIKAVLSLEMTLSSFTHWVEPTLTKVLADGSAVMLHLMMNGQCQIVCLIV